MLPLEKMVYFLGISLLRCIGESMPNANIHEAKLAMQQSNNCHNFFNMFEKNRSRFSECLHLCLSYLSMQSADTVHTI